MQAWRPVTLLKIDSNTGAFLWNLRKFYEHLFLQNTSGGCFWDLCGSLCGEVMLWLFVYLSYLLSKCHFIFLINWNMKLEKSFDFCFYTEVEIENIKISGFSIFKILEHWNSNLKFVFDQVYYNTRVPTQVNTSQHESTRIWQESTRVRHESTRVWHKLTRIKTSQKLS